MAKEIFDLYIKVKVVTAQRHLKGQVVKAVWKNQISGVKTDHSRRPCEAEDAVTAVYMDSEKAGCGCD